MATLQELWDQTAPPQSAPAPSSGDQPKQRSLDDIWQQTAPVQAKGLGAFWRDVTGQGPGPRKQLFPERMVRGLIGAVEEGPKLMRDVYEGRVDPMSKEAVGRSLEAAAAYAPIANPAMGMAKTITPVAKAAAAPTREALKDAYDTAYDALRNSDVKLRSGPVMDFADKVHGELTGPKYGFRPRNQPEVFSALEELKNPQSPGFVNFTDIDSVRQQLGHVIRDKPGSSAAMAAGVAREHIDNYLANIPGIAETANAARGNYAAAKRSDLLEARQERGELHRLTAGSAGNVNALRQQARAILVQPKLRANFNAEEQAFLRDFAKGSLTENTARFLSRLGPKHPIIGWGGALATDLTVGGGAATAQMATGAIAQWLAERLGQGRFERLSEMTRARSPLGQSLGGPIPKPTYQRPPTGTLAAPVVAGAAAQENQRTDPLAEASDALGP